MEVKIFVTILARFKFRVHAKSPLARNLWALPLRRNRDCRVIARFLFFFCSHDQRERYRFPIKVDYRQHGSSTCF